LSAALVRMFVKVLVGLVHSDLWTLLILGLCTRWPRGQAALLPLAPRCWQAMRLAVMAMNFSMRLVLR